MARKSLCRVDYSRVRLEKDDVKKINDIVNESRKNGNGNTRYHSAEDFIERCILSGIETYEAEHGAIV
jgi:hypothetical protein